MSASLQPVVEAPLCRLTEPPSGAVQAQAAVCHLIASNFVGGPEKQLLEYCVLLERHGWRAVVGSFRENRNRVDVVEEARSRGLPVFLIDTHSPFSPMAIRQLHRQLRAFAVRILVTYGYKPDLVGYFACRGTGCVQIPFVRGYTAENWRVRRYEAMNRQLLRRLGRVLCVSEGTRRVLVSSGLAADRITVVHNAIDCARAAGVTPHDLRAEFGLPSEARLLVAAGRLSPEKGHRFLVAALARLATRQPRVVLVLLGTGPEETRLQRQADAAGLGKRVVFAGFRKDVLEYLAGADLVVNPSVSEGLPNVLLEAFALGRPVVATNVGGTPELVQPGRTGWLVPAGDPEALAEAIREALDDEARAARLAANARQLVSSSFTFAKQAEELVRVYGAATRAVPPA